jgi:hypothetical protein
MDFSDEIKKIKPKISLASLKTYNSLLKNVHRTAFGDAEPDIKNFKKEKVIMEYLNKKPYNTRKTFMAALLCIEPDNKAYKDQMNEDIRTYRDEVSKSELTDKLDESAISQEEIDGIMAKLKQNAKALLKKQSHTIPDLMEIQNWVILSMYYGHIVPRRAHNPAPFIVPRRAQDYVLMLHKNADKKYDNYVDMQDNRLVFNKYKTATKMGETLKGRQELEIPPSLKKILKKWIAVIPAEVDNLFFNSQLLPLSNVSLNQRLNAIFGGKKASVNSLRHFYLTTKYKDLMEKTEEMDDEMEQMGSSSAQAKVYIKINDKE